MADEPTIRYAVQRPALRAALWVIDKLLRVIFAPKQAPVPTDPARILVCMQAHLGDAILATAVLPPLRRAFPGARLGFLVHPVSAELLAMQPGVERVHRVEHWRDRLLEGGDAALEELLAAYPGLDKPQFRALAGQARTERDQEGSKRHSRELFRALNDALGQD